MNGAKVKEYRKKHGINQKDFWSKLGVTQSGGSRYETGRAIPKPVQMLLDLVYVKNIKIDKVTQDDYLVIEHVKANKTLYKSLLAEAKAFAKEQAKKK